MSNNTTTLNTAFLREQLSFIEGCSHEGVSGVFKVDSGNPGPTLGVTIHTHGNEPSGLMTLAHFRDTFPLQNYLRNGAVYFVLNNPKATHQYLAAQTDEEIRRARFVDRNMNRLPEDTADLAVPYEDYEVVRARELLPVWSQFTHGLDIHSTTQPSQAMIMNIGTVHKDLIHGFPIEIIISNIDVAQIGIPPVSLYGGGGIPVMGLETGQHEDSDALSRGPACVTSMLQNLGMIDGEAEAHERTYKEYFVDWSLMLPDTTYQLVRVFGNYESVSKGDVLATNGKDNIVAPFDGHVLFATKELKPIHLDEEVLFLSHPVRTMKV